MKTYGFNTLRYSVAAVCMIAGFSACQEFEIDSQDEYPPKMEVDAQESYTLLALSPNVITFNISSNTPWKITSDAQWCTADPAMSSASSLVAEITVTAKENDSEKPRTAILTVSGEGVDPVKITVNQEAKAAFTLQAPEEGNVPRAGGKKLFKVKSNRPWKITTDAIWLDFSALSGEATPEDGTEVEVTAKSNNGMRRTAEVSVSNGLESKTFEVIQDGVVLEFVETEAEALEIHYMGETKEFKVEANIEWTASSESDRIEIEKQDDETVRVTVKPSKYFNRQNYEVVLSPVDASLTSVNPEPLVLSQDTMIGDFYGSHQVNDDGSLTLNPGLNAQSRVITKEKLTEGTLIWTFRDTDLKSGLFDINAWASGPNFHAWIGKVDGKGDSNWMRTRGVLSGGASFYGNGQLSDITVEDLNAMKTLKLTILPNAEEQHSPVFTLYMDDVQVGTVMPDNPLGNDSLPQCYFGFANDSGAEGTMTIESFEFIPYEQ